MEPGLPAEVLLKVLVAIMIFVVGFGTMISLMTFEGYLQQRVLQRINMDLGELILSDEKLMYKETGQGSVERGIIDGEKLNKLCQAQNCDKDKLGVALEGLKWAVYLENSQDKIIKEFGEIKEKGKTMYYPVFLKSRDKTKPMRLKVWVAKE